MTMENLLYSVRNLIQKRQEKRLVFITCLLSAFCGIVGMGVGLFMIFDTSSNTIALIGELGANSRYIRPAAYLMLMSGIMAFIGGLLGCAGCVFEQKFLLVLFLAGVGIVCILLMAAFVLGLLYKYTVYVKAQQNAKRKFDEDITKNNVKEIETIWKPLQMELRCCGLTGWEDYLLLLNKTRASLPLPIECCVYQRESDSEPINREKCLRWEKRFSHQRGCGELIGNSLTKNTGLISLSAAATIWIQLPAGYMALLLFWMKKTGEPGGAVGPVSGNPPGTK